MRLLFQSVPNAFEKLVLITTHIDSRARLDLSHHIYCLIVDGALYQAPLQKDSIKRCLDFGTGTGIWAIDFADEFPSCEVIGTDLSPIQPSSVPPNLSFYGKSGWYIAESETYADYLTHSFS